MLINVTSGPATSRTLLNLEIVEGGNRGEDRFSGAISLGSLSRTGCLRFTILLAFPYLISWLGLEQLLSSETASRYKDRQILQEY
jgi:hypothetical protein